MQQFRNPYQQLQINGLLAQYFVHISPVCMYRLGEPRDSSALRLQFGFNHISYV